MEKFPSSLKQLNSALIILTKPKARRSPARERATSGKYEHAASSK
jgi:hypothetical protein